MVADGRRHSNFKNYRKILGANTLAIMHIIYTGSHFITCFWVESCVNIRVHTLEILFIFFTAPPKKMPKKSPKHRIHFNFSLNFYTNLLDNF